MQCQRSQTMFFKTDRWSAAGATVDSWGLLLLLFNFPSSWVSSFSLVRIWRTFAAHCRDLSKICMGAAEPFEHRESLKMSWPWTKHFALVVVEGRRAARYSLTDSSPIELRTLASPWISCEVGVTKHSALVCIQVCSYWCKINFLASSQFQDCLLPDQSFMTCLAQISAKQDGVVLLFFSF